MKGAIFMETRWAIMTIFLLATVLVGSSALAGGYGYKHYYGHHRHHSNHHYYSGGNLFIGTMLGFTLGALLVAPPPPQPVYIYREYTPNRAYREEYVYIPPAGSIHREPSSAKNGTLLRYDSCLQTREYTTTIVIEGQTVEAYGTKCLRPDGGWSYGPAQPVPGN